MTNPDVHAEGPVAGSLEQQTAKLPSDLFLWAAVGSILISLLLKVINKHHDSTFIGQWVPTFLLLGIYNKLVKTARLGPARPQGGRLTDSDHSARTHSPSRERRRTQRVSLQHGD
jgi:hypothetical protein